MGGVFDNASTVYNEASTTEKVGAILSGSFADPLDLTGQQASIMNRARSKEQQKQLEKQEKQNRQKRSSVTVPVGKPVKVS